jgi:hypothetical protein
LSSWWLSCGVSQRRSKNLFLSIKSCKDELHFFILKIMPDRAFKRELDSLQVTCCHKEDKNCAWVGPLNAYQVCIFIVFFSKYITYYYIY